MALVRTQQRQLAGTLARRQPGVPMLPEFKTPAPETAIGGETEIGLSTLHRQPIFPATHLANVEFLNRERIPPRTEPTQQTPLLVDRPDVTPTKG